MLALLHNVFWGQVFEQSQLKKLTNHKGVVKVIAL